MTTVCSKCGHSWEKHNVIYWPNGCSGNGPTYGENCGCQMTQEQAERKV